MVKQDNDFKHADNVETYKVFKNLIGLIIKLFIDT
jgi:hypothetical protein